MLNRTKQLIKICLSTCFSYVILGKIWKVDLFYWQLIVIFIHDMKLTKNESGGLVIHWYSHCRLLSPSLHGSLTRELLLNQYYQIPSCLVMNISEEILCNCSLENLTKCQVESNTNFPAGVRIVILAGNLISIHYLAFKMRIFIASYLLAMLFK